MTPELWQKVSAALEKALDLDAEKRPAFLDQLRRGEPDVGHGHGGQPVRSRAEGELGRRNYIF